MKPDVLVCWPINCDYPLWRKFITENRDRFDRVIIIFTNTHDTTDYRNKVREKLTGCDIMFDDSNTVQGHEDWRDIAVNQALKHSKAEWVWFTEQDFLIPDPEQFFKKLESTLKSVSADVVGFYDGGNHESRLHPACLFVKRALVDKTSKNFGIVVDVSDHFSIFSTELHKLSPVLPLITCELKEGRDWKHLAGLSHNLRLLKDGLTNLIYQPEEFYNYLKEANEAE